jgi:hypothetical protein
LALSTFIPHVLGLAGLFFVAFLNLIASLRLPRAAKILWSAFGIRVLAILFGFYVMPLPDSGADAVSFEQEAWQLAQLGFFGVLAEFSGLSSYFISWLLAVLYSLTDRSLLMAQSVSLLFGMGTVFLGWLLARKLWGNKIASKAGWVLALFPTLILYSALTMREAYVWFFLLVALHGVVDWAKTGRFRAIALAVFGFFGATFFHGAMIVGAFVFALILLGNALIRIASTLSRGRVHPFSWVVLVLAIAASGVFVSGTVTVPKLGSFDQAIDMERLVKRIDRSTRGLGGEDGAAYPQWTAPTSPVELIYKAPIRATYFTLAPFPWDVRKSSHLIGLFDGFLYTALVFLIWRCRKVIWEDRAARAIVLILVGYLLVFGMAIGNFGTGVRHRAKFVAAVIVLAAPLMPRIRFFSRSSEENNSIHG